MLLSKGGLIFGGCYLALATVLFLAGSVHDDPKVTYVLFQLAVYPGLMLVVVPAMLIGPEAEEWLMHSWVNSIPAMLALNLALAYGLGWVLGRWRARLRAGWAQR